MGIADVNGKLTVQGYNCFVRVSMTENAASADKTIGYVTSFQATEDFQVQEAVCLGHLGPVAIDPQGYTCSINIAAFISADLSNAPNDSGTLIALEDNMPDRDEFMSPDSRILKFSYLDFYDRKNKKIIAKFKGVLVTSNGIQSEGNTYVRTNVAMRALRWDKKKTASSS